jgi:nucleotide-binding universal stress UspA family protein
MVRPTILCPIDFSEPSRGALRFAAIIAEHFFAGLTVATVDDPLLTGAAGTAYGEGTYERQTEQELERFVKDTFKRHRPTLAAGQRSAWCPPPIRRHRPSRTADHGAE